MMENMTVATTELSVVRFIQIIDSAEINSITSESK